MGVDFEGVLHIFASAGQHSVAAHSVEKGAGGAGGAGIPAS